MSWLSRIGFLNAASPSSFQKIEKSQEGALPSAADVYIPPEKNLNDVVASSDSAVVSAKWRTPWLAKKQVAKEMEIYIGKIELLCNAPTHASQYFFDHDLVRLVSLSQKYPKEVRGTLRTALEHSPNREQSEPWFRLAQIACGDESAILPALDNLC